MTMTATPTVLEGGTLEQDRLAAETSKLRARGGLTVDRIFQLAGTALPVLGILAIVVAWYGVSHTAREWRQTPYLVSGGLLGLGLIFLGGFAYFSYWLTKLVDASHRQTAVLERIEAALAARGDVAAPRAAGSESVLLVDGRNVVHQADCPLLIGVDDAAPLRPGDTADTTPCPVCEPAVAPAPRPARPLKAR